MNDNQNAAGAHGRRFGRRIARAVAPLALGVLPIAAGAQQTLRDALRLADHAAFGNRIAAAAAATRHAEALAPMRGILPSVRLEGGFERTTDPIGVFGSTLRQRAVTAANFDPLRLNHPGPLSNHSAGLVIEQPLMNADAWIGHRVAAEAAAAGDAAEAWARINTHADVVTAYFGVLLAAERVRTLGAAALAAHAHVAQAQAMVEQGLATKSDALLASVRAGNVDAQLTEADAAATTARRQLAVLLGAVDGTVPDGPFPGMQLPSSEQIRALVAADTAEAAPQLRADLRATTAAANAAAADARRARARFLPRLNSFARLDWNSAARPFAGGDSWTVGVIVTWTILPDAGDLSAVRAAAERARGVRAQLDGARAAAALEVDRTRAALVVALTRLAIAERGAIQGAEAHRIVARKYAGGLATVIELLDAQAVETEAALARSQARWDAIVADAQRRRALGLDPAALADLESTKPPAGTPDSASR